MAKVIGIDLGTTNSCVAVMGSRVTNYLAYSASQCTPPPLAHLYRLLLTTLQRAIISLSWAFIL